MANTTNFNWETPDDTDLVKDGAAAIRTLGSAIDTSLVDLKGGTTGQILSKTSNTDMDFTWIANDVGDITEVVASSPLTGGGSSGSVSVGIQDGTTAQKGAVQLENSTSSTSTTTAAVPASVKSAYDLANAAIPKSLVDAAGDLIYATANDTPARLALGTAGQILTVNSGATAPEWKTQAAASSGLTFIHRSSFTNVATVDYDYFTSSYYNYIVVVESIKSASSSGGSESLLQMRYSGSTETGSIYNGSSWSTDRSGTGAGLGYNSQTSAKLALDIGDSNDNSYVINFEKVGNASENPSFHGTGVLGDTTYGSVIFAGKAYQARTYTGFRLLASSGNISGTVSIYGLAKS